MAKIKFNKKEEPKITFRGKEMKLSEGRSLLDKILDGRMTLELTKEERTEYESMNSSIRKGNERRNNIKGAIISKEFTETEYLSLLLSSVPIMKMYEREEYCNKNGHSGESVLSTDSSGRAFCYCHSCQDMYDRPMTSKEASNFNKLMKTHMTI
jgi:hypothetical protein